MTKFTSLHYPIDYFYKAPLTRQQCSDAFLVGFNVQFSSTMYDIFNGRVSFSNTSENPCYGLDSSLEGWRECCRLFNCTRESSNPSINCCVGDFFVRYSSEAEFQTNFLSSVYMNRVNMDGLLVANIAVMVGNFLCFVLLDVVRLLTFFSSRSLPLFSLHFL
jgi:hypothetical protein